MIRKQESTKSYCEYTNDFFSLKINIESFAGKLEKWRNNVKKMTPSERMQRFVQKNMKKVTDELISPALYEESFADIYSALKEDYRVE